LEHIARWVENHQDPTSLDHRLRRDLATDRPTSYWQRRIALHEFVWAAGDAEIKVLGVGSTTEAEEVPAGTWLRCRHWTFDQKCDLHGITHYPELWVRRADVERLWPLSAESSNLAHSAPQGGGPEENAPEAEQQTIPEPKAAAPLLSQTDRNPDLAANARLKAERDGAIEAVRRKYAAGRTKTWSRICDEVRKEAGKDKDAYGYGDRSIEDRWKGLEAETKAK
jgi:hypothetical protein